MRGGGLLDRITGPVVAGVGGVFTYLESGDAEAAVKETIKASVEAISPLPVPEEKIVMELEQVELRLVYYGSLPTEVDQQAQRKAEAEQAQKKREELSRPGLMKRDRPRPPDGTSLRGRLDHEIIKRIINQHKTR